MPYTDKNLAAATGVEIRRGQSRHAAGEGAFVVPRSDSRIIVALRLVTWKGSKNSAGCAHVCPDDVFYILGGAREPVLLQLMRQLHICHGPWPQQRAFYVTGLVLRRGRAIHGFMHFAGEMTQRLEPEVLRWIAEGGGCQLERSVGARHELVLDEREGLNGKLRHGPRLAAVGQIGNIFVVLQSVEVAGARVIASCRIVR